MDPLQRLNSWNQVLITPTDLNLSDDQKQKLSNFLTEVREKVGENKEQKPNASMEDLIKKIAANRTVLRDRLVTPDSLLELDAPVIGTVPEFLLYSSGKSDPRRHARPRCRKK